MWIFPSESGAGTFMKKCVYIFNTSVTPRTLAQFIFWKEVSLCSWVSGTVLLQGVKFSLTVCLYYSGVFLDASIKKGQRQAVRQVLKVGASWPLLRLLVDERPLMILKPKEKKIEIFNKKANKLLQTRELLHQPWYSPKISTVLSFLIKGKTSSSNSWSRFH